MRIAHLDTGATWRGGQAQVLLLADGLKRRGHECLVLAAGELLERAGAAGHATRRWSARGDLDVVAGATVWRALRAFGPDVVHAHTARAHAVGVPAARLAGAPVVVVARRVAVPLGRHLGTRLKLVPPVDRYLCVSAAAARTLTDAGVSASRTAVVPSGIDLAALARAAEEGADPRALVGLAGGAPLLVAAASLTSEKDPLGVLEAFATAARAVAGAGLAFLGDGPLRGALETRIARLGLEARVRCLGFRGDAPALIRRATALAVASRSEGLGTAVIEALALGVPVVARAVGGIPEIVEHEVHGLLVPAGDVEALAEAMVAILGNPSRRAALARAGPERAARYSAERMVEATLAEYAALLAAARERSG